MPREHGPSHLVALLVPLVLTGVARAQEEEPPQAKPAVRPVPRRVTGGESHLLQFERMILAAAPEELRPADFEIGQEKLRKMRGEGVSVLVDIQFRRQGQPLPVTLDLVRSVVRNVETMGDSPWRILALHLQRESAPDAPWRIVRFTSSRPDAAVVQGEPGAWARGHAILSTVERIFGSVAIRDAEVRPRAVEIEPSGRGGRTWLELRVEFDVIGERFRSGYVRVRDAFVQACEDPSGPFSEFGDARGEKILTEQGVVGASYELRLCVRHDAEPDAASEVPRRGR